MQNLKKAGPFRNPLSSLSPTGPATGSPFGCFGNLVIAVICVAGILAGILRTGILRIVRRILTGIVGIVRIICVVCIAAVVCIVCHNCFLLRFFIGFTPLLWLLCVKIFFQFLPIYILSPLKQDANDPYNQKNWKQYGKYPA